jgi:Protein of unknown function/Domain of unknown function (DUF1835)
VTASTLHIVFSQSAAGSLRQAMRDAGREDGVAGYFDNLALGPLNPFGLKTRLHWVEEELHRGADEWWGHAEEIAFWKAALVEDVRKVAWISRRSAVEYCGFLEWLWRLGDLPCEVVDLTDMQVGSQRAFSPALLPPEEIAANTVWGCAEVLDATARSHCHGLWHRLRVENESLRVVDRDGLRSAPITFFDQQLLSFASADWQKPARIIGYTMGEWSWQSMEPREPYFQAGDMILAARIVALVELGVLEGRGNLMNIRQSEVRLCNQALGGGAGAA